MKVDDLLLRHAYCESCQSLVGARRGPSALVNFVSVLATLTTSLMVLSTMGNFWALLWFTVPIASFAYIKARLCPLETKQLELAP